MSLSPARRRAGLQAMACSVFLYSGVRGYWVWRIHRYQEMAAHVGKEANALSSYMEHQRITGQLPGSPRVQAAPVNPPTDLGRSFQQSGLYSDPSRYDMTTAGFERFSPETAKSILQQHGIPYSESSFTERAAEGDMRAVKLFLKSGMPINARDANGDTALIKAVGAGDRASWGGNNEIIKTLIHAGADVNIVGGQSETALKLATFPESMRIMHMLVPGGAKE